MATEKNTPSDAAAQHDAALSDILQAMRLAFDVVELAADPLDGVALGREPTPEEMQAFRDADAAFQAMVDAVRSWPVANCTEALAKLDALDAVTFEDQELDNHRTFRADVARLAEAGQ